MGGRKTVEKVNGGDNGVGLIRNLKIYVHNISYIITFIIFQNNVVDSNYSMLLGRPWLRDVKVAHD